MSKLINWLSLILANIIYQINTQQSVTIKGINVNFLNRGSQTEFTAKSNFDTPTNSWIAVGLNKYPSMVFKFK